jgi:hypothetical protein
MADLADDATVLMLSNCKTSSNVVHLPDEDGDPLCGRSSRTTMDGRPRRGPFAKTRRQVPWHDICEDCERLFDAGDAA